jgi:hypothetical protein
VWHMRANVALSEAVNISASYAVLAWIFNAFTSMLAAVRWRLW